MSGDRFDDLARALAAPVSRRRALRIAGVALLGVSVGGARPGPARARTRLTCANQGDTACRFPVASLDGCCYTSSHGGGRKCCDGNTASLCLDNAEICCFDPRSDNLSFCPPSQPKCCYESGGVHCCPTDSTCCATSASHCCAPPFLCTKNGCAECSTGENKCGKKCCGSNQYCASSLYGGLCCRKGATHVCVAPSSGSKGPATCCTDDERCCASKGKVDCCGPKQKCHGGKCTCPKKAGRRCGAHCCKKNQLCCGSEQDKGKSCCDPGDKCCGHSCCPKDQACCTGSSLAPHCCPPGDVCAPKPGAGAMSEAPCCPKLRLAHAQGKVVCCPVGTIEIGGNCCPPDQLGCCDFPCADGQICVRGACVRA
ncbi:MAG: hypothetical protein QOE36_2544 [Gaiellaceae bacterium]|nr:hypothetical protein [Gaiellaceae bacterium]